MVTRSSSHRLFMRHLAQGAEIASMVLVMAAMVLFLAGVALGYYSPASFSVSFGMALSALALFVGSMAAWGLSGWAMSRS